MHSSSCTTTRLLLFSVSRFQFAMFPIEVAPLHCCSMTNVVLRSERSGCQRELLIVLVSCLTPALPPLLPTAPSSTCMSPSCVRRSPRSGPIASMLSNRSHVSSGGRLINCLAEAKLLWHLTLMGVSLTPAVATTATPQWLTASDASAWRETLSM